MRLTADEKAEIIRVVINSDLGIKPTLKRLGVPTRIFYNWYNAYLEGGQEALESKGRSSQQWNRILDDISIRFIQA